MRGHARERSATLIGVSDGREHSARTTRAIFALIILLPLASVVTYCAAATRVPWIVPSPAAPWVMPDRPVSADLEQWGDPEPALTRYAARFAPREVAADARLAVQALGDLRLWLDDELVGELSRTSPRGRVAGAFAVPVSLAGAERLIVEVRSATGPGLIALTSEGIEPPLSSASGFVAARGEDRPRPALPADDTRRNARALAVESPAEALARVAPQAAVAALLGALGFLVWRRLFGARAGEVFGLAAPLAATAFWLGPVAQRFAQIPLDVGFDARHHLLYAQQLLETRALPDALEGWSTYHPPLFYALAAAVRGLGGEAEALRWLGVLAGVGAIWVAWAVARRIAPEAPARAGLAACFAAVLPVQLVSAAYFSNEALHATLAGAALCSVVGLLCAERTGTAALVGAGALLGAAILAKFTALVLVPIALFFVAWRAFASPEGTMGRATRQALPLLLAVALVGGWFYLHTYLEHGTPLLGNWALPGDDQQWWQQPAFHTPAYFLGFGEALRHPYLSGFHSFWDAIYSTAWGDGYIAGRTDPFRRHEFWNYDYMSAGYLLALPATALVGLGFVTWARRTWQSVELASAFLLTATWGVALAFTTLTVQLAFFAQAKAAYGLMLSAPFAFAFATGYAAVDDALGRRAAPALRAVWAGVFVATAAAFALAFTG